MRLLFGSDPSALENRCLSEIRQQINEFPDQRAFLVVPEQNKVQMERSYLNSTESEGLLLAEVLSFRRLAHRLLDETGLLPARRVDNFGKRMILFRALKEKSSQLHSFGHLADRSGFISEIEAVIGDLKRHLINPEQLRQVAGFGADKALVDKCHDLSVLMEEYNSILAGQALSDADDDLNRLAELLEKIDVLAHASDGKLPFPYNCLFDLQQTHIFVCGFGFVRDFTPQEYRVLDALSRLCASLTVSIQSDAWPMTDMAVEIGPDAFMIGRRTIRHLSTRFAGVESILVEPSPTRLQETVSRLLIGDDVIIQRIPLLKSALTLISLPSAADEIEFMAGEIRRLTQTGQYRYQDIAIALCETESTWPLLRTVSRRFKIPFFLDKDRTLAGTSLFRFILGILELPLRNWSRDAIMAVLRSGMTPLDPADIDLLENDLLQRGLFRKDRLFAFNARTGGKATTPKLPADPENTITSSDRRIRQAIDIVFEPMRLLTENLRTAASASDCCRLIRQYFAENGLVERIMNKSDNLKKQNESDAAQMLVSAHAVLGQLLQQLETIVGDVPLSLVQLRDTIRSGLTGASVTLIPSGLDQIMIGDWHRIGRQPCSVLFVIGARMDILPPKSGPEGLLKDLDRQLLSEMLQIRIPSNARDRDFADAGSIYQLLSLPTDMLYIGSSGGEPADITGRLRLGIPDHRMIDTDDLTDLWNPRLNSLAAARHRQAILRGLPVRLSSAKLAGWQELNRNLAALQKNSDQKVKMVVNDPLRSPSGTVSPEIIQQLYAPIACMSVSQLEKYAACPFSHLAAYILRLRERAVFIPESTDTGTLLHGVAELALRDLANQLSAVQSDQNAQKAILNAFSNLDFSAFSEILMNLTIENEGLFAMNDPGIRSSIGRKLKRIAAASLRAISNQLESGEFLPHHLEWCFGPNELAGYAIAISGNRSIQLRGKIDRIDLRYHCDQQLFRIIDYKSGIKTVDPDDLYYGLALQLPTYLSAYSANNPGVIAEQAAYFHFDWPILRANKTNVDSAVFEKSIRKKFELRTTGLDQNEIQLLQYHTQRCIIELSENLFAGQYAVSPRKFAGREAACRYCPYSAICGFNRKDYCYLRPINQILSSSGERLTKKQVLCRLLAAEMDREASR